MIVVTTTGPSKPTPPPQHTHPSVRAFEALKRRPWARVRSLIIEKSHFSFISTSKSLQHFHPSPVYRGLREVTDEKLPAKIYETDHKL